MVMINLRHFYPWYTENVLIEVTEEVAEELQADRRYQKTAMRRIYRNKAHYSLDREDGIEYEACLRELSPHEVYEFTLLLSQLCGALNSLPKTQGQRVEAHFLLGKSVTEIAQAEGVSKSRVSESIERGLQNMKKYLKTFS